MTRKAKALVGVNTLFVLALPVFEYLQPLFVTLHQALPQLQEFLPENTYRVVGLTVVLVNIIIGFLIHKDAK